MKIDVFYWHLARVRAQDGVTSHDAVGLRPLEPRRACHPESRSDVHRTRGPPKASPQNRPWHHCPRGCILRCVAAAPPNRVFLTDVRGGDLYLRATWHPESATIVFSHWNGEVCMASTPSALTDSTKLIDLMVRSLSEAAERRLVAVEPQRPRTILAQIRDRLRPRLAEVVDASARFISSGRGNGERGRSSQ